MAGPADNVQNWKKQDEEQNKKTDQKPIKNSAETEFTTKYDNLFVDIQNILEGERFKEDNYVSSFGPPSWTPEEIDSAKIIFKQCLDIDLDNVIQSGRDFELKKSLLILLSSNVFPENSVDEVTKFVDNFVQSCEQYEMAKQDLREIQEKEKSIDDQKTAMKQLSSKFLPIRKQAEAVDHEIAELERQLTERKAKKTRLGKMLQVLADQATTSKQSLVRDEEDHVKFCELKKEQAEKVINDVKTSWDTLKNEAKETSGNVGQSTDIGQLRWTIQNFSKLVDNKMHYSDIFYAGGYKWRMSISTRGKYLSMYLHIADRLDSLETPPGPGPGSTKNLLWSISVINQNPKFTVKFESNVLVLDAHESDWIFPVTLIGLKDATKGFLVKDVCTIEAQVSF
uniref:MATH domain-containing protein n=1 Tax=Cannabis sativa TaxID=3483 RepID=A0A803NUE9_CANSA